MEQQHYVETQKPAFHSKKDKYQNDTDIKLQALLILTSTIGNQASTAYKLKVERRKLKAKGL